MAAEHFPSGLSSKDEITLREAAEFLGCDVDSVLYYAANAFRGLTLWVLVVDELRTWNGETTGGRFKALCRLDSIDAGDLLARGFIDRPVIRLLQQTSGNHFGSRTLADAFLHRVDLGDGAFGYEAEPCTKTWTITKDSVWVKRADIEAFASGADDAAVAADKAPAKLRLVKSNEGKPYSVPRDKIAMAFKVKSGDAENLGWWVDKFRNASRNGLRPAVTDPGRGRRQPKALPGVVAGWLVDKGPLDAKQVATSLRRHFPDLADVADSIDPSNS